MSPVEDNHSTKTQSSPATLTNTCLECGSEYTIGRQPSPYCSRACRERLTAVLGARKLLRRDEIDHETIGWVVFLAQPSTKVPHRELRRLVGKPLSIDEPGGLSCVFCGGFAILRVRLGQPEIPAAYCLACYRQRLTESLVAEQSTDLMGPRTMLARIFAPEPLFERDDEARSGYRLLKQQAVRRRLLISSPTPTDKADLLAWSEAISKRTAAAKRQGLELLDALDDVLNDALDDLGLSPRRRNRLVHRVEALIDELGRSFDMPGHRASTEGM